MLTRHAVAGPLLVGPLRQVRHPDRYRRPALLLTPWCPFCRDHHRIAMSDDMRPDGILEVAAPCPSGPLAGLRVAVGADPAYSAEAGRVLDGFRASQRRWRSEQRFRELAAERELADRESAWSLTPRLRPAPVLWGIP